MRNRLILFLLIFILPLQAAWSAADFCCIQETMTQEMLSTDSSVSNLDRQQNDSKSLIDLHCGLCHVAGVSIPSVSSRLFDSVAVSVPPSIDAIIFSSIGPEPPERPKWASAV